jgi:hypothetical protein
MPLQNTLLPVTPSPAASDAFRCIFTTVPLCISHRLLVKAGDLRTTLFVPELLMLSKHITIVLFALDSSLPMQHSFPLPIFRQGSS